MPASSSTAALGSWTVSISSCAAFAISFSSSTMMSVSPKATARRKRSVASPVSFTMLEKTPAGLLRSSEGLPISTARPASITTTMSDSMIVCRRWAMAMRVQSWNSSRMVFWISASVSTSTLAVASSRTRILEDLRSARASATSCFCPMLNGDPPSRSCISRPAGLLATTWWRCARFTACHICASVYWLKGSRLKRRVPVNKAGTWGMSDIAWRS
mmetsp:Transcript_7887/g.22527  ORF Transcript_7887/g.22527 Transcript_7887/m.22527 type:complete len:215 (+) Transcript_7887:388-1032(+)